MPRLRPFLVAASLLALSAATAQAQTPIADVPAVGADPNLPAIDKAHEGTIKRVSVIGWAEGGKPKAVDGFEVEAFARGLDNPRWLHVLANGDVLVAEASTLIKADAGSIDGSAAESANRVTLLRDADKDGVSDSRFTLLANQSQPFGMLAQGDFLYVANTDGVMRYPFKPGETEITAEGTKILELPAGGYNNHWTRNIVANPDGTKLYVTVGSASNAGEYGLAEEEGRAAIHEINPDGTDHRIFASGLRNPNGLAFEPASGALWTAVNERDDIGDDLVPDYVTSVRDGGFYGWPFYYWGKNRDPRIEPTAKVADKEVLVPDYALGAHTSTMSIAFPASASFPEAFRDGAFVAQRGSWNRSQYAGYRVLYLPFVDGKPSGQPIDFLTGFFRDEAAGEVYGRPTGLAAHADGSLLIADDAGNTIWRVAAAD
ncbi:sorbosone dehydrogenase family protein [Aureimonas sp. AU12]|uniref:PQQ-dependent sugar dehydrogenase n=1 Tax=Aureimonas sp. AU12 TaxID=1638161 RepID=UPI00078400D1|nr:sorbosone dehydrogenase family protein [Aureimonas sp. AU12]